YVAERDMSDQVFDVHPPVAQRAAVLVGFRDLGLEDDHSLESRLEVGHPLPLYLGRVVRGHSVACRRLGCEAGTTGFPLSFTHMKRSRYVADRVEGRVGSSYRVDRPGDATPDVTMMRSAYNSAHLSEDDLAPDWLTQFGHWLVDAVESRAFREPNAMVLATADAGGRPSARTVLLRGYDERGLVFYTNYASRKGSDLAANPYACGVFP